MKFLSKKQVTAMVVYSPSQIARLEKDGKFPKRVRLGQARVAWLEQDILDWMQSHLDDR